MKLEYFRNIYVFQTCASSWNIGFALLLLLCDDNAMRNKAINLGKKHLVLVWLLFFRLNHWCADCYMVCWSHQLSVWIIISRESVLIILRLLWLVVYVKPLSVQCYLCERILKSRFVFSMYLLRDKQLAHMAYTWSEYLCFIYTL